MLRFEILFLYFSFSTTVEVLRRTFQKAISMDGTPFGGPLFVFLIFERCGGVPQNLLKALSKRCTPIWSPCSLFDHCGGAPQFSKANDLQEEYAVLESSFKKLVSESQRLRCCWISATFASHHLSNY